VAKNLFKSFRLSLRIFKKTTPRDVTPSQLIWSHLPKQTDR
jgi:hypothetical protein